MKLAATEKLLKNGKIYTLTQSRNYTMPQLAEVLTKVSGSPIGYKPVTLKEFEDMYNEGNEGHMLSSMYDAGARGLLDEVSADYKLIMGHEAQSLIDFLTKNYQK